MSALLQANERKDFKRSALTALRREGNFPAIVYGNKKDNKAISINEADFIKTIRDVGRNGVMGLNINGSEVKVILSEYQMDPIKNEMIHADFLAFDQSSKVNADVRIVLVGDAAGVKDGGVMQQPLHEVSVTASPNDIPPSIEVDVANLQVGETITIADIKQSKGYLINHDEEEVIASILPPKQEEEIDTGEEQEPGKPENEEGRETEASE
ncbi:50S ribosomal protein L25/general stress protein Ctc [Cytobacillus spongiae]|jgi:large subunit ribosomal protein L25|uniref:50S ribosomal protein L25/general stress protein Ctc n=1 Tax=Cytobacillus spongiae TaxID=2901381 RepID=UPI001F40BA28|nr:50S ribosomal protein L25/general stress protein Ctc [Cytobacillus spongiae]UII56010.1 50S ribosomal protein L25/general stress protein Ctc [Cytobacillus spongiae]